jgi:uncharacterized protein YbjT (DUF2867 family)
MVTEDMRRTWNGTGADVVAPSASAVATSLEQPTLVLGGTGKTGRRVAERLVARGLPVRLGSRSGKPPFDWEDRATWAPALSSVGSVYLTYYPDIAVPGAVDTVRSLVALAVASGVQRLVLLSGRGEDEAERAEEVVQASGVDWTIVRSSWFNQNFSENYLLEPILAGEVALPAPNVGEPFVDADDIADAAVAALTDDKHIGQLYELTGPKLLTFAEAIAQIARASGRQIRYVQIPMQDYVVALEQAQLPADFVALIKYLFTEVLDGRNAYVTDGVQRALGRAPRDFAEYARCATASGAWKK